MKNTSQLKSCYGCGVCAASCPKQLIDLRLDKDGFYEPYIVDLKKCTNCGLCVNICAYLRDKPELSVNCIDAYASWSNDKDIRRFCSSGGIAFEISKLLIQHGYKVIGVRYNVEKQRAEHYIANNIEDLIQSVGSKYIQSYTVEGLLNINRKQKYVFTGTPCQVDSFRRYIRKFKIEDNFVLLDFFCHGVPSMIVWNKYLQEVERSINLVNNVAWRHKDSGWHDSWVIALDGEQGKPFNTKDIKVILKDRTYSYMSKLSQGDLFFRYFLSDTCLGKACYKQCKYKYINSSADIRFGDLWGSTYSKNEDGVSGVLVFTEKGRNIISQLKDRCTFIEHDVDVVCEGQMRKNPSTPMILRNIVVRLLRSSLKLGTIYYIFAYPYNLYDRAIHKIQRLLKK